MTDYLCWIDRTPVKGTSTKTCYPETLTVHISTEAIIVTVHNFDGNNIKEGHPTTIVLVDAATGNHSEYAGTVTSIKCYWDGLEGTNTKIVLMRKLQKERTA